MAENGRDENSSEGASQNQATQQNKQQQKDPKSQPEEITSSDDQPVVVNSHDYRGDPEEPFQDGSELSSPPPEDSFSSGGEQNSMDEGASLVPPPLIPSRGYLGYISPGPPHQMMLPMVALHSDSISPDNGPSSPPPPEQEQRRVLLQQIEYYFSKDNLTSDKYLVSQMDGDHFVPISIVAAFNQVKKLTTDTDLIVDVIRESTMLQLSDDNDKVRAIPEKRCVLILREIPKETPKESITALFQGKTCPNYVTCEFAYNDCWYVTFDTEEETQKAHAFLREEVREFLGQPIRARIKCTTVQRSSGVPKKRNTSFPPAMHSIYNGGPQLPGYYQQPNIVPWSHASPSPYYDPGNYVQYMGNGFPPHQQQQQQQQQQPAGTQQTPQQRYNGPQNRFSNVHNVYPAGRMDGERAGRGRGGSNEWHGRIDRGNSPPMANGDVPGERVRRGDHYSAGGGGGGAGGGRYRRDNEDTRKVPPRMTRNNRHPRIGGGSGAAGESVEKGDRTKRSQPAPRQQNKHQPKIEMGPTNFPPLPTSVESGITPSQPPTFTTSHTHTSNEEGKTVADIVKGKRTKDTVVNLQGPSLSSSNGGVAIQTPSLPPQTQQTPTSAIRNQTNTTKSSVNQPGATPLVNQQGQPPNTINTAPTGNSSSATNSAALPNQQISVSTVSTAKVQTASQSVTSKPTPPSSSSVGVVNNGAPPTQTLSTVVSSGPQVVTSSSSSATQRQQRQQQSGTKIPVQENKASTNNHKSGTRYSDRENGSINRQNNGRNTQVHSKSDNRSTASINNRNRHREREKDTRRPGGLNSRSQQQQQQQQRPSPKTPKKQPPPLQAPPPPPTPTTPTPPTVTTNTATASDNKTTLNVSNGDTSSTTTAGSGGGGGAKSEKLSYAQMAQKKAPPVPPLPPKTNNTNNSNGSNSQGSSAPQGVATTTPSTSSSTSSSNNNASSTQGSSSLTPTTTTNQSQTLVRTTSAPTSPQGGPSSLGGVARPNGTAFQSNVAGTVSKSTKSLPPNNVGGNSLAQHPTLTASKSAPPSPSKEGVATKGGATL